MLQYKQKFTLNQTVVLKMSRNNHIKVLYNYFKYRMTYSGIFIAFEGVDGSGKSTQIKLLREKLTKFGYVIHTTTEPSSGKLGPILRDYLSNPNSQHSVDALLFAADRIEHYYEEILPKLQSGAVVICDRYKLSSIIYQGLNGLSEEWITMINDKVPDPDLTIYLDVSADIAVNRFKNNRNKLEKFETQDNLNSLIKRYESYLPKNTFVINAEQSIESVLNDLLKIVIKHMR